MNIPKYSLCKLSRMENKVRQNLIAANFGYKDLNGQTTGAVIENILENVAIPHDSVPMSDCREVVASLLVDFMGTELTTDAITKISRRVAGWEHNIPTGKLFKKWDMSKPVWACLQIIDIEPVLRKPKKYIVTFTSFTGSTVNMVWEQLFNPLFMCFLIKSIGGLRRETYDPTDLFGLHLTAVVHYDKGRLSLSHICASSSQLSKNKTLLKARKGKCIGGFTTETCFNCPLGIDKCSLARHSHTYPKGTCRINSPGKETKHKGYIQKSGYCMQCIKIGNYASIQLKRRLTDDDTTTKNLCE